MNRQTRLAVSLLTSHRVARTLYHGTTVDNEASIKRNGLLGGVGSFVEQAYGEYMREGLDIPDLVFAADKKGLNRAVNAMVHHVSAKLNKDFHDVTDNDILNHGLLVIIHDEESRVPQRPYGDENYYGQYPHSVEPGDYFSEELWADKFVKGRQLLRLLERYGQWPRSYGSKSDEPVRAKKMRGKLLALALNTNPGKTKQEIIDWVRGLSDGKVKAYFQQYLGGNQ